MTTDHGHDGEASAAQPRIEVSENGPSLVSGGLPLDELSVEPDASATPCAWRKEREIPAPAEYALCRCGHSRTKPFCDGAHLRASFDGAETASRAPYLDQAEKISGPTLDLTDAPGLCAGAGFCHRAGGIWDLTPKSDDAEARKIAIEIAADCPSGRLVVWDKQGKAIEPGHSPSISLVKEADGTMGPLWVRGGVPIASEDGPPREIRNRVTLCRCGKSANKPFCDGAHLNG